MSTIRAKLVKTRKAHFCYFCDRNFCAGTRMLYHVEKQDDQIVASYCCQTCRALFRHHWDDGNGWGPGEMMEYVHDNGFGTPEEYLAALEQES